MNARTVVLIVATLAAQLACAGACAATPLETDAARISTAARSSESVASVGTTIRHYVDEERRSWDRSAPRPLQTTLWYPTPDTQGVGSSPPAGGAPSTDGVTGADSAPTSTGAMFDVPPVLQGAPLAPAHERYPLVLISHGTGGCAPALLWLGHALASHGYIVAAVDHHGNTCGEGKLDARGFFLWWERAKDLSAVLDRLLNDPTFGPHIDRQRIGAAGFSLGGYTVITVAGGRIDRATYLRFCHSPERDFTCGPQPEFPQAPQLFQEIQRTDPLVQSALAHSDDSYRDPRVRAVFAMAPVFGRGFAAKDVADIRIPIQIVVGAGDTTAPPATNARRFASLIPGARLLVIPGQVGHYDFIPVCTAEGKKALQRLCSDAPGIDRSEVQRKVSASALEFFARTLPPPHPDQRPLRSQE